MSDGKKLEKLIGKALSKSLGSNWVIVRVQDTKGAQYFLPPTPADFMGIVEGGVGILIECKTSEAYECFSFLPCKSLMASTQYAYHRMWVKNGGISLFVHMSEYTGQIQFWDGNDVTCAYVTGWQGQEPLDVSGTTIKDTTEKLVSTISLLSQKIGMYT